MELETIDWNKYCLKSIYSDKEFYIKVYDVVETIPSGFKDKIENCFDCACFDGQNYNTERTYLRCSLIDVLYKIVEIPKNFKEHQLSLFDFL